MLQSVAVGGFDLSVLLLICGVVFFGGLIKGTAGFGFALVSTAVLATVFSPTVAVVVMILPMLVSDVHLLGELDRAAIPRCVARFWPYVLAAAVGTVVGMAILDQIPQPTLKAGLGLFTLGYVVVAQPWVSLPGTAWARERCFRPGTAAKVGMGLVSGVVFGASNVAVQVVAYLDSHELDHSTFVGVLAMILVGISVLRLLVAWGLGLFASGATAPGVLVTLSTLAAIPGLAGVATGQRLRRRLSPDSVTVATFVLLLAIGVKLLRDGVVGTALS